MIVCSQYPYYKKCDDWKMLFKMISEMPVSTVPVNTGYQKYLKFEWFRKYKFIGMPVDDSYLPIASELECKRNANATVGLLCKLDFVACSNRSTLKPTQKKRISSFCHRFGRHVCFSK